MAKFEFNAVRTDSSIKQIRGNWEHSTMLPKPSQWTISLYRQQFDYNTEALLISAGRSQNKLSLHPRLSLSMENVTLLSCKEYLHDISFKWCFIVCIGTTLTLYPQNIRYGLKSRPKTKWGPLTSSWPEGPIATYFFFLCKRRDIQEESRHWCY